MPITFSPTPDVAAILHILIDVYERRGGAPRQAVRVRLDDVGGTLPGYTSQVDPTPRVAANEQLQELEERALVHLGWQPGQKGHLLDAVTLEPGRIERLYALVGREPLSRRRERLRGARDGPGRVTFYATVSATDKDPDVSNNDASIQVRFKDEDDTIQEIIGCSLVSQDGIRAGFDPTLLLILLLALSGIIRRKIWAINHR